MQRLKAFCPSLGKAKIAETLCRAGLHLGTTTVGRILKEPPRPMPSEAVGSTDRVVTAKRANHVWHTDLTTVPTGAGFWAPWLPFALPQFRASRSVRDSSRHLIKLRLVMMRSRSVLLRDVQMPAQRSVD